MKNIYVPWELIVGICVPVVTGLFIWAFKAWVNSLKKNITEDVENRLNGLESRVSVNEQNIKTNEQTAKDARDQAGFLMKHLLERKS